MMPEPPKKALRGFRGSHGWRCRIELMNIVENTTATPAEKMQAIQLLNDIRNGMMFPNDPERSKRHAEARKKSVKFKKLLSKAKGPDERN